MTPFRYRSCLRILRWSFSDAAKAMNIRPMQVRQWSSGKQSIPSDVEEWLERLVAFHEQNPPPSRNRNLKSDAKPSGGRESSR